MQRLLTLALLILSCCLVLPVFASAADRPFTSRFSTNVNGQIIIAANTIMQCPTNTVDPLLNSGCTGARAGTNARNNNTLDMGWLDVDSDSSTFDSSSAQLLLPTTGHVLFAGLYWTGLQKKAAVVTGANGYKGTPRLARSSSQSQAPRGMRRSRHRRSTPDRLPKDRATPPSPM